MFVFDISQQVVQERVENREGRAVSGAVMQGSRMSLSRPVVGIRNDRLLLRASQVRPSRLKARCRPSSPLF